MYPPPAQISATFWPGATRKKAIVSAGLRPASRARSASLRSGASTAPRIASVGCHSLGSAARTAGTGAASSAPDRGVGSEPPQDSANENRRRRNEGRRLMRLRS